MSDFFIQLVRSDPNWAAEFDQTKSCVLHATEGWVNAVEHIGGTALVQSASRPIIDCMAGLSDLNGMEESAFLIEGMNYRRCSLPGWVVGQPAIILEKPRTAQPTHRVWLVETNGPLWQSHLAVRDYFRENESEIERLSSAKLHIAGSDPGCLENYERGKSAFFSSLVDQIRSTKTT